MGDIISEMYECQACGEKDYIEEVTFTDIVCQSCGNDARTFTEFMNRFKALFNFG